MFLSQLLQKTPTPTQGDCTFLKATIIFCDHFAFRRCLSRGGLKSAGATVMELALKLYRHLKTIIFFQRGCVWEEAEPGEKNGLIAFHLLLPGALCVCLLTPGSKLSSLRTKQPLLCVRPAWAHLASGTWRFVLYFTH